MGDHRTMRCGGRRDRGMQIQIKIRLRCGGLSILDCLDVGVPYVAEDLSNPASNTGKGALAFTKGKRLQERVEGLA